MWLMDQLNKRWLSAGALLAALATFAVFMTARGNQFVDFDDLAYIPCGLSQETFGLQTVKWAFTSYPGANWHPLTMLSLAIDAQLWGNNPFGYHLTNILLHCCSVFLSCFLFATLFSTVQRSTTSENNSPSVSMNSRSIIFASLAAALFFGLHPLRVESVVWASERKDVLCLFWVITTLLCYLRYCYLRLETPERQFWRMPSYWMVLLPTCLAMLSKPLAVSVPLFLLIIDWYPLVRLKSSSDFRTALFEKMPLILMSTVCSVMTMFAQRMALSRAPQVELTSRLLLANKALLFYLWKTLWPSELAALYPHPGNVARYAFPEHLIYVGIVALITVLAVVGLRHSRFWLAFWMFHILTLTPMLGIIQVGAQWVADRYSYLPALGMAMLWGYGVVYLVSLLLQKGRRSGALLAAGLALFQLLLLVELTLRQIPVWRTTESLTSRIIGQIPEHPEAPYYTRAKYRNENGAYDEALRDMDMSLSIARRYRKIKQYPELYIAKAHVLSNLGRLNEALEQANLALEISQSGVPPAYVAFRNKLQALVADEHAGL